jgi:hypothetical protein
MTTIYNTTITDKSTFKISIVDTEKFTKLTVEEQAIFELIRNSLLEIMPLTSDIYDIECVRYAENFAFINLQAFELGISKIVDAKIKALQDAINIQIQSLKTTITTTTTTTNP